jgi:hypothetical protein
MVSPLLKATQSISKLNFDIPGKISIKLVDGREIIIPIKYFPEKKNFPLKKEKNILLSMIEQFYFISLTMFIT